MKNAVHNLLFLFFRCFYCKDMISFVILYTPDWENPIIVFKFRRMLAVFYAKISDIEKSMFKEMNFISLLGEEVFLEICSLKNQKTKDTRLGGEILRNYGLKYYWGIEARNYTIARGLHGKPYLKEKEDIFFNISHSGEYIMCAFSDSPVGVDIEKKGKMKMPVARRFFHAEEILRLENIREEKDRAELFYRLWSVKESFLKYTGEGLSASLSSFTVKFGAAGVFLKQGGKRIKVKISACSIDPAYVSYVCSLNQQVSEIREIGWAEIRNSL